MASRIDGLGLGLAGAGSLFMYAGIKGLSVPHALQALVQGRQPTGNALPITGTATGSGAFSGGGLAGDFLQYAGKVPYVWGGANPNGWDCSGSCNYVICHDGGLDIPGYRGGTFDGTQHGPSTFSWLPWAHSNMAHLAESQAIAGDLVLWLTHMGVVTRPGYYISAYDTQDGTVEKPIHGGGPVGEVASFWRFSVNVRAPHHG